MKFEKGGTKQLQLATFPNMNVEVKSKSNQMYNLKISQK